MHTNKNKSFCFLCDRFKKKTLLGVKRLTNTLSDGQCELMGLMDEFAFGISHANNSHANK